MSCPMCASANQEEFPAEMVLHFNGMKSLDRPGVLIFPKVLVCLDCGFSQFDAKTKVALLAADELVSPRPLLSTGKRVASDPRRCAC